MSTATSTLDVEITIDPRKHRHPRRRRDSEAPAVPRVPRITRLIALAIKFQDMVDGSEVHDYADLARLGYVSRARITQIMNLLNLAPDIQEDILLMPRPGGACHSSVVERQIRTLTSMVVWADQRRAWQTCTECPAK